MSLYKMQRACIETEYSTIFFDVCHVRSDGSVGDLSVILLTISDLSRTMFTVSLMDRSASRPPSKHP
jgi:hypothetical protein